jgi:hypothetical protein
VGFFAYEPFLEEDDENEGLVYTELVTEVYRRPRDIVTLLNLARHLLTRGCGRQSLVCLCRALECLAHKVTEPVTT